mgnify:CR=1 FL=1
MRTMKKAQEQAHDLLRRAAFTAPPRLRHEIRQLLKDPGVGDEDIELRDYVPRVELQGTESARRILEDRVVALEAANRALRVERDEARADMHTAQDMIEKVRAEYSDEIVAVAGERNRALAQVGALREHLFALEPHDVLCGYTKDTRIGRPFDVEGCAACRALDDTERAAREHNARVWEEGQRHQWGRNRMSLAANPYRDGGDDG